MFVPFDSISPDARIWIYQSNRELTDREQSQMAELLRSFTDRWAAHGSPLRASFDIRYGHFVILAADEGLNQASGCSIDDSVRAVKEVEQRIGTKLFERQLAAFLVNDRVMLIPVAGLKEKHAQGIWNENTLTFNNLVGTRGELAARWIVPAGETWLRRYLSARPVNT